MPGNGSIDTSGLPTSSGGSAKATFQVGRKVLSGWSTFTTSVPLLRLRFQKAVRPPRKANVGRSSFGPASEGRERLCSSQADDSPAIGGFLKRLAESRQSPFHPSYLKRLGEQTLGSGPSVSAPDALLRMLEANARNQSTSCRPFPVARQLVDLSSKRTFKRTVLGLRHE